MRHVEFGIPTDKSAPTAEFGVAKGIFRDLGVDLRITPYYGGPRLAEALENGSLGFAQIGTPPAIVAMGQGARFKIVGSAIRQKLHLYLGIRAEFEDAEDLRGMKLGLLSLGSCDEWVARAMLANFGLDPDADVTFVPIYEEYARVVELIREGRIDGALAIEPNMSFGEADSVLRIWAAAYDPQYLPRFQWTVLAASEALMRDEPDLVRTLLQGYARSAHAAAADRDEYVAFLSDKFGVPHAVMRRSVEREFPHYELDCRIDMEGLARALALQRRLSDIGRPNRPEELLEPRFLRETARP